jgi:hypothetical protein
MKIVLTFILLSIAMAIPAVTLTVTQDGTGQYSLIQQAIIASVNGDTILVYPGTYYENINYSGKNITIASLELTTGNPAYRDSTIIDGNNNGSCVTVVNHENNACIYGFTITHGSGWSYLQNGAMISVGGGFRIRYTTNFKIHNCEIIDNIATHGAGININDSTMNLKDTTITNNYAYGAGGGIFFEADTNCIFDSTQRCSIYENYAGSMNDIAASEAGGVINIILDTFTVNPPTKYYADYTYLFTGGAGYFTFDILNAYRTEVNHDLYVSPNGNDSNDGLTPAFPLKTITKALHTIASDSLDMNTIYLAPGIYSSADGQLFPLGLKAHIRLIGDSLSIPVILNQFYEQTFTASYAPGIVVKNLIIEHNNFTPNSVFYIGNCDKAKLANITINPVHALAEAGIFIYKGNIELENITLEGLVSNCMSGINFFASYGTARNISINDCHTIGNDDMPVFDILNADLDSTLVLENVSVTNCSALSPTVSIIGIMPNIGRNPLVRINNMLIANNTSNGNAPISISLNSINTSSISNCTFVNNSGGSQPFKLTGRVNVSNCLFSNNGFNEINIRNTQIANYISHINFYNNMISGYPASVYVHASNQVAFNDFNFSANPSFAGTDWADPLSYRLNFDSPCINAGTPDTTGLYLPEFDLYGNNRIYNGIIDIGCNEWNGTSNEDDYTPQAVFNDVRIYPNPFRDDTTFHYNLGKEAMVDISIYNAKGQRIKHYQQNSLAKGSHSLNWDGKDNLGLDCSSGIYIVKMMINRKTVTSKKITLIK